MFFTNLETSLSTYQLVIGRQIGVEHPLIQNL
jgi:hypothetical protein